VTLPPAIETGNETEFDGIGASCENDRDSGGCSFGGQCSPRRGERNDNGHGVGHQLGGQCWQSVEAAISRAMFDCDIAAFDIASVLEALPNGRHESII